MKNLINLFSLVCKESTTRTKSATYEISKSLRFAQGFLRIIIVILKVRDDTTYTVRLESLIHIVSDLSHYMKTKHHPLLSMHQYTTRINCTTVHIIDHVIQCIKYKHTCSQLYNLCIIIITNYSAETMNV